MKYLYAILALSTIVFSSCNKDGIEINFKMDYNTNFTIESGGVINLPLEFFTPDITSNSEAEFEANDTRKDKIKEIKLESLRLSITSPDNQNFDFLKDIFLYNIPN